MPEPTADAAIPSARETAPGPQPPQPQPPHRQPSHPRQWIRMSRLLFTAAARTAESRTVKLGFAGLAVALGTYVVISQWSEVRSDLARLGAGTLLLALGCVLASWTTSMLVWRFLMAAAGSRLPVQVAARIFFVGQLGKYLPGSVWPVLAQMELGRAHRVPRERSAAVAMLTMVTALASGLLVTLIAVPFCGNGLTGGYRWAFLAVPVLLVCLHPRVLNPAIRRALRAARRPAPDRELTGRTITTAMSVNLIGWSFAGAHLWLLATRLGAAPGAALPIAVAGFAFAWCVGFLVVMAPAGAGVRELILVSALTPVLHSIAAATVVALVSRLLTVLADLIAAAVATAAGRIGH